MNNKKEQLQAVAIALLSLGFLLFVSYIVGLFHPTAKTLTLTKHIYIAPFFGIYNGVFTYLHLVQKKRFSCLLELNNLEYYGHSFRQVLFYVKWILVDLMFLAVIIGSGLIHTIFTSSYVLLTYAGLSIVFYLGGNEPIKIKKKEFTSYQDALKSSPFSRNDAFFSRFGRAKEGIILGTKLFRFSEIKEVETNPKFIKVIGENTEEKYIIILYSHRLIEYFTPILKKRKKK